MIYFFYGNSEYLLAENLKKWKQQFLEKYGDAQLFHVREFWQIQEYGIEDNIVSVWMFSPKKLIILDNVTMKTWEKGKDSLAFQDRLWGLLERKGDDTIIVFSAYLPDKRGKFYKYLMKLAKDNSKLIAKEYSVSDASKSIQYLQMKFPKIQQNVLMYMLQIKSGNLEKSVSELEKLYIAHTEVSKALVQQEIVPELEESIFVFIDQLTSKNKRQALRTLSIILEQSDIMSVYYWLLSNMRTAFYICLELDQGNRPQEISHNLQLWKRAFLVEKYAKSDMQHIMKLYIDLIELDTKMKQGKLSSFSQAPLKDALELCILSS